MKRHALLLPVVLIIVSVSVLQADTIHVPADSSTIQSGINGAVDGDTVMVSPGIYHEYNIDFLGKAIVVTSTDPLDSSIVAQTIVDADSLGHVFYFHLEEDSLSILSGLTITGGYTDTTGGISCFSSSPTITHNIITGNTAGLQGCGGGISCWSSSSTIAHNIIINNLLENGHLGGGVFCESSTVSIENNVISDNSVHNYGYGGGIACLASAPTIAGNTVSGNYASYEGGGIYCLASTPTIAGNIISGNHATRYGGGIFCQDSPAIITDNTFTYNHGGTRGGGISCKNVSWIDIHANTIIGNNSSRGGGIACESVSSGSITENLIAQNKAWVGGGINCNDYSSPMITNNTIVGNLAHSGGGGISSNVMCLPILTNNTIAWNIAEKYGGGIWPYASSHMIVSNTILWGNDSPQGPEIRIGSEDDSSSVTIDFSDVQGGRDEVYIQSRSALFCGQGMIDAAPLFMSPEGGDFYLITDSPCIDSGDPDSEVPPNGGDRIDMGAYEYQYPVFSLQQLIFENMPLYGERGETVVWDFTVENACTDYVALDGWVAVSGPKSSIRDSILGVVLSPGEDISGNVYLYIPYCTPLGMYTVKGRIGIMHEEIWDGEVFDGEVVESFNTTRSEFVEDDWKIRLEFLRSDPSYSIIEDL